MIIGQSADPETPAKTSLVATAVDLGCLYMIITWGLLHIMRTSWNLKGMADGKSLISSLLHTSYKYFTSQHDWKFLLDSVISKVLIQF